MWLFSKLRSSKRTQALDQEDLTLAWDDPEPETEHTDVEKPQPQPQPQPQPIFQPLEGLGVPLEGSGGLGAAKFTVPKNRIIRSNLTNTIINAINTIRRIIRLRRMTHPWILQTLNDG